MHDSGEHPESPSSSGSEVSTPSSPSTNRVPFGIRVTTTTTVTVEEAREDDPRPFGYSYEIAGPFGPANAEAAATPAVYWLPGGNTHNVIPLHVTNHFPGQPYNNSHAVRGEDGTINHINAAAAATTRNSSTAPLNPAIRITTGAAAVLRRGIRNGRAPRIITRALARGTAILNNLRAPRMASQAPAQGAPRNARAGPPPAVIAPQRFMEVTQADNDAIELVLQAAAITMRTNADLLMIHDNNGLVTSADNQLVHSDALPQQNPDDLVALINSGTWDVSAGGDGSPQSRTQRTRPGRTIASAFESRTRSDDRDSIRGSRGGRPNVPYTPPASVVEQSEFDAQHLATVNRRVQPPAWLPAVLLRNQNPLVEDVIKDMPFFDPTNHHRLPTFGVVRIVEVSPKTDIMDTC